MTYAYGTAQYHWGVSPKGQWVLYDVKKDPGCKNDLSKEKPRSDQYAIQCLRYMVG